MTAGIFSREARIKPEGDLSKLIWMGEQGCRQKDCARRVIIPEAGPQFTGLIGPAGYYCTASVTGMVWLVTAVPLFEKAATVME